jgi:large subunit ribosomal protein L18
MQYAQRISQQRIRRTKRAHARVRGTTERPRLSVHRGVARITAQVIDDVQGITLASASDYTGAKLPGTKTERAIKVGQLVAEAAKAKGVTKVVFDRGGAAYSGRVKALAEAARAAGLQF